MHEYLCLEVPLADMKVRNIKIDFTHTHTEGCHILLPPEFWTLKDGKQPGDNDENTCWIITVKSIKKPSSR